MSVNQELSDHDLFKKFLDENKSENLFRMIMNRYKQRVYWQVRRILITHDDADEVAQIVFIKLWQSAESFRFTSALSSFIFRIAFNESMSMLKQKRKFISFDDIVDKDGHYSRLISTGHETDGDEIAKKLQLALLTLPEKQRLVFNYRYFDEMPYTEMSEITGTSEGALKASYHFAVEKIKLILAPD